ncbi:hypothetical protein AB0I53_11605 [Saccharopolyspora sp. NPDC050389]|uniref:hypothetical protein n=1 Tax=Saccharopolyspora sp. NPDC050389 TaxID=3155516 RepID=UPI0033E1C57F
MGRQRGSASVAPILLVLGMLGVAVAVVTLWPLVTEAGRAMRSATATVVESRPCGTASARDLVEVRIDGVVRQAPFDGCGHARGQQLPVQVPADPGEAFVVSPAGSADSDLKGQAQRANWVLLTLAAVAGGGYGLMLRRS